MQQNKIVDYGHFSTDGSEFIVTRPDTPRAFDNFIWNDAMFSCVQQTGVGYMDYQVDGSEAIKLLTGIGRICDFDVHGRDGLMSRLVYIRDNDTKEFWTVNWEPVRKAYQHYACTHGAGYTIIENTTGNIAASFRIFAPAEPVPAELWTLKLRNAGTKPRNLSVFVYAQVALKYKWGFDSYGDMIFRSCVFNEELNAAVACKHPQFKPHNYLTGFLTADRKADGFDGTRDAFVGLYNTTAAPQAVIDGACRNTPGSSDSTIMALQFNLSLAPTKTETINLVLGGTDGEAGIAKMRSDLLGSMDQQFERLKAVKAELIARNHLTTPDEHLNAMFNTWIKQETLFGATWCRWGWMGYRDIVQHGYGVTTFDAPRTRRILLDALKYQYAGGLALRGWNPLDKKAYSDSALWLVFTLIAYLKETGDLALLDEVVPFFDGGQATALEHVERALDFLETNKGAHGVCLIKFGDWNDSLTAVGKEGRGESIWLSMAYAEALRLMAGLFEHMGQSQKRQDYQGRYQKIRKAINDTCWDGRWYVRCFDDNGRAIGSDASEQGKIFANTQSWAMISDVVDPDRREQMLKSCDEMLLTDIGYLLLTPTFTKRDEFIGRISCLEPGVCENGTVYSHINVWMILGLLRAGLPDKAYDTFKRITPGYFNSPDDPKRKCPPYVYANGHFGPAHRNNPFQAEFTWITGSVAWFYNTILREMVGVDSDYAGLRITPRLPSGWDKVSLTRQFRGKTFQINIRSAKAGKVSLVLNGKELEGDFVPLDACGENNTLDVTC